MASVVYGDGLHMFDAQYMRPKLACLYFICRDDQIAIIETGTAHTVPYLLAELQALGLSLEQVRYIIPTHVHLDHAGGAGALMARCPNATLVIHPRGKRHMVNPEKLAQSTAAVYGQARFEALYGKLLPIEESRMLVAEDGHILEFAADQLSIIDTPGHARHHFCIWDRCTQGMFTGDTCGLSYRELDDRQGNSYLFATTTPTQFDPEALVTSLDKLLCYQPQYLYLTHFGRIACTPQAIEQLKDSIAAFTGFARDSEAATDRIAVMAQKIIHYVCSKTAACNLTPIEQRAVIANDAELNAQGLDYWLKTLAA